MVRHVGTMALEEPDAVRFRSGLMRRQHYSLAVGRRAHLYLAATMVILGEPNVCVCSNVNRASSRNKTNSESLNSANEASREAF